MTTIMETTEKNYVVEYQEAYMSLLFLRVSFKFNDINYDATGDLISGNTLEDINVLNESTNEYIDSDDEAWKLGERLLCEMKVENHLTF